MKKKTIYILIISLAVAILAGVLVVKKFTCLMNDCNKFIQTGSEYCKFHTCNLEGCVKQKSLECQYCSEHGCLEDGCSSLVVEENRTSFFCEEHRCKVGDCGQGIYINNHCLYHNCCETNCDRATKEYYSYCEVHKPQ